MERTDVADGVQAGAAQWDGRRDSEAEENDLGCTLGRKLWFKGGGSDWKTEEGWQTRMS